MSALRRGVDRCDRCGSEAFVRVELAAGELLFCAHHYRKHEPALLEAGASVHDERDRINAAPSPSA